MFKPGEYTGSHCCGTTCIHNGNVIQYMVIKSPSKDIQGLPHGANKVLRNSLPAELGVFGFFAFFVLMRSCLTETWSEGCWIKYSAVLTEFVSTDGFGIGVKAKEDTLVDQWVLVLSPWALGDLGVGRSDNSLDHGAIDDPSDIGVGNLGSGETGNSKQRD